MTFLWTMIGLVFAIAALFVGQRAFRYQRGTYERFRLLSIRRALSFVVIALALAVAVAAAVTGQVFTMIAQTAVGCVWLWADSVHRHDDDFFNRFRHRARLRRQARRTAHVSAR